LGRQGVPAGHYFQVERRTAVGEVQAVGQTESKDAHEEALTRKDIPEQLKAEDFGLIARLFAPVLMLIHTCTAVKMVSTICRKIVEKLTGTDPKTCMTGKHLIDAYNWLGTASHADLIDLLGPMDAVLVMLIPPRNAILHWLETAKADHIPALTRQHLIFTMTEALHMIALIEKQKIVSAPADHAAVKAAIEKHKFVLDDMLRLHAEIIFSQAAMSDEEAIDYMLDKSVPLFEAMIVMHDLDKVITQAHKDEESESEEPGCADEPKRPLGFSVGENESVH